MTQTGQSTHGDIGALLADPDRLMTGEDVAVVFGVTTKTVTRWAKAGKLPSTRTLGGHRRYRAGDVATAIHDNNSQ